MSDIILQTHKLTKEFKGFTAVSQVGLSVVSGSIHALIGPNGAGLIFPVCVLAFRRGVMGAPISDGQVFVGFDAWT